MLSHTQILILNAARSALTDVQTGSLDGSRGGERVSEASEMAEHAIFRVLNVAYNYAGVVMTREQLHNRPAPAATEGEDA